MITVPRYFFSMQLILFLAFQWEEIILSTLILCLAGVYMGVRQRLWPLWISRILTVLSLALAFWFCGRGVNTEMGLNLLTSVIALKLVEAREERDWRMLTLGFFVLWATGTLFVKTPVYFAFSLFMYATSLYVMVRQISPRHQVQWKKMFFHLMKALPLAVLLFFVAPRFGSGLWIPEKPQDQGQIGFSEDVRPGDVGEIRPSGAEAFEVAIEPLVSLGEAYWRGITLSGHDGWNWFATARDSFSGEEIKVGPDKSYQEIFHSKPTRRLFGLEFPQLWTVNGRDLTADGPGSFRFMGYQSVRHYRVQSGVQIQQNKMNPAIARELVLSPAVKKWPSELGVKERMSFNEATRALQKFFAKQGFSYSLTPGLLGNTADFLAAKKGWCAHYASFTGLVLRSLGFPTRLVAGYLGGEFNPGGHYSVSEDDAHVWVESFVDGRWHRVDPTLWIVPERSTLGGRGFLEKSRGPSWAKNLTPEFMRDFQQWVEHQNFRFLTWSEGFDKIEQTRIARKMGLGLEEYYSLLVWILVAAIVMLAIWERLIQNRVSSRTLSQRVWGEFLLWLRSKGLSPARSSTLEEISAGLGPLSEADKTFAHSWMKEWNQLVYADAGDELKLKKLGRRLGFAASRLRLFFRLGGFSRRS